ncbi:hypothetical protein DKX38_023514 [Salix brachista]|uniref:Uncharacterized protein n=1 Tax=Salix brachista TaxID=2182728 RepID=A0A5N5JQ11_9ROSI|nr:hypothetical protein DKX38_023514 [Salix brachista]
MKGIRVRDLQRFVRWRDPNDCLFNYAMESTEKAYKASAIIEYGTGLAGNNHSFSSWKKPKRERGKKMKKQAVEWKKLAEEATAPNGIPSMNFDKLVNEVLLSRN